MRWCFVTAVIVFAGLGSTLGQGEGYNNDPFNSFYMGNMNLTEANIEMFWTRFQDDLRAWWEGLFRVLGLMFGGDRPGGGDVGVGADGSSGDGVGGRDGGVQNRESIVSIWEAFQDVLQRLWEQFQLLLRGVLDKESSQRFDLFMPLFDNNIQAWFAKLVSVVSQTLFPVNGTWTEGRQGPLAGLNMLWSQFEHNAQMSEWIWDKMLILARRLNPCCGPTSIEMGSRMARVERNVTKLYTMIEKQTVNSRLAFETGDWKLVFRVTSGNGHNANKAWVAGVGVTTEKPTNMKRSNDRHFRDPVVGMISNTKIRRIKYSLFKDENEVAYVIFRGTYTNRDAWFNETRVLESSWTDLTPITKFNCFAIRGDKEDALRRFYISTSGGGCAETTGYTAIIDTTAPTPCNMDRHAVYPQVIYSQINGPELWNSAMYGRADYAAVFLEYDTTT